MKKYIFPLVIVLSSGCSSTQTQPEATAAKPCEMIKTRGMDCISIQTIRDYTPLDRSHLILWGAGRAYVVQLFSPSVDLESAFRLSFSSEDGELCPYGGDEIIFDGMGFPGGQRIASIKRLSRADAEALQACYGRGAKDKKTSEPREIEGAEVEELGKTDSN